jgi:hypothetical protein
MDPVFWSPSSRFESEKSCKNSIVRENIPTLVQKKYCWIWSAVDRNAKRFLYWVQGELSQDKNSGAPSKNAQQQA